MIATVAERLSNVTGDFRPFHGRVACYPGWQSCDHIRALQLGRSSKQVAPDTTKEGQAENRRVTVKILQNKGIAGN
jgi:hypothetical protein